MEYLWVDWTGRGHDLIYMMGEVWVNCGVFEGSITIE